MSQSLTMSVAESIKIQRGLQAMSKMPEFPPMSLQVRGECKSLKWAADELLHEKRILVSCSFAIKGQPQHHDFFFMDVQSSSHIFDDINQRVCEAVENNAVEVVECGW